MLISYFHETDECIAPQVTQVSPEAIIDQYHCFKIRIEQAFTIPLPFFDHNEDKVLLWQPNTQVQFILVRPSSRKCDEGFSTRKRGKSEA